MNPLRDLLNERRWSTNDLSSLTLHVLHRGAPDDEREVPGATILRIESAGIVVLADVEHDAAEAFEDGDVVIPYHRVLRVTDANGDSLWMRRPDSATGAIEERTRV